MKSLEIEINKKTEKIKVYYINLNPGGNKTAIVIGNKYDSMQKKIINDKILNNNPDIEQVGFIDSKRNLLEMAGGEFCINATRCAIWTYLKGEAGKMKLNVSGYKEEIIGGITNNKDVYVELSIYKKINYIIEKKGVFNFVKLDGILINVIDINDSKKYIEELRDNEENAKLKLKELMKSFNSSENAIGIILLEKENDEIKINPIIWVKTIDTLYYETACGSGSLATAIYMNYTKNIKEIEILQPSGYKIKVKLRIKQGNIYSSLVSGKVMEEG